MKLISRTSFKPACVFAGRDGELGQLAGWLASAPSPRRPVRAFLVEGAPGSGVTAFLKRCFRNAPCLFASLPQTREGQALALSGLLGGRVDADPESLCEAAAGACARHGFALPLVLDGWDWACRDSPALTQLLFARLQACLAEKGGAAKACTVVFGASGPGFPLGRGLPAGVERLRLAPFSLLRLPSLFPDWSAGDLVWTACAVGRRCSALALLPSAPSFRESFLEAPQERLWLQPWRAFERAGAGHAGEALLEAAAASGGCAIAGAAGSPAELALAAQTLVQAGLAEFPGQVAQGGPDVPGGPAGKGGQGGLRLLLSDPLLVHGIRLSGGLEQARRGGRRGLAEALLGGPAGCFAPRWPRLAFECFARLAYRDMLPFPAQGPVPLAVKDRHLPRGGFVLAERGGSRVLAVFPAVSAAPLQAADARPLAGAWKAHCLASGRDPSRDLAVFACPIEPASSFGLALRDSPAWQGMRACLAGPEELLGFRPVAWPKMPARIFSFPGK